MDTDSDESDDIEMLMPTTAQAQTLLSRMPQKQPYCEVEDLSKKKDPDLQYKVSECILFILLQERNREKICVCESLQRLATPCVNFC